MKKHIILTILLVSFCKSVSAALPATANLSIDPGSSFSMELNIGIWFATDITGFNGLNVGFGQTAAGSHGGSPDGTESPNIDNPWEYFGATGMHQTTSEIAVISDDGAGNVTLDFSGWGVTWDAIQNVNLGSGADAGVATMTCATDCSVGDSYTLTYLARVPEGHISGFGGIQYWLNLNGTISVMEQLPDLTQLSFDPGVVSSDTCISGSCLGLELSPGFWAWAQVEGGNDGGIVVGKNQLSGGQETGPSHTNTTPGDMTAAWFYLSKFGTFFADNSLNVFSANSNDGVSVMNDFNVAWGGGSVPMGGGTFEDYSITYNCQMRSYSFRYANTVPEGDPSGFGTVPFMLIARGGVYMPDTPFGCVPVVEDISLNAVTDETANWIPSFTLVDSVEFYSCEITTNASNGNATVSPDCSSGTYTSGLSFVGQDSFTYTVTNKNGLSESGTVVFDVNYDASCQFDPYCLCKINNPLKQVVSSGGGQSNSINETLKTTFTGHILTESGLTSGAKNSVKICPGTTVGFSVTSSTGMSRCTNNNIVTASSGRLGVGDKLVCTNKPNGSDTDKFIIKEGF